jgi:hypothetical protein
MAEFVGPIAIPEVAASGVFPLVVDFGSVLELAPQVIVHRFGFAENQAEQRFYAGPGLRTFRVQLPGLRQSERDSLMAFWEARRGSYQPFTLQVAEASGTVSYTVRFASPQIALDWLREGEWAGAVDMVEEPSDTPTYAVADVFTRVPSTGLKAALLGQVQECIPLLRIYAGAHVIYVSDRRVSVGGYLYQPRLLEWSGIQQSIDGAADTASFTLGNADRVFTSLAEQVDLWRARVEFAVFHVSSRDSLNLWAGELSGWDGGAANEFRIQADDGLPLRLAYPARKITRQGGFTVPEQPVNVGGKKGISRITATSIANDTAYGKPLKDVYVNNAAAPLPVECEVICGRDESEFASALAVVGRGPIGAYSSGDMRFMHTLDGQTHHGGGFSGQGLYGLRRSLGGNPATGSEALTDDAPDHGSNWFALDSTSTTWPQTPMGPTGAAFLQIRRVDEKGVQPLRASERKMQAWVAVGLGCYVWSGPGARTWQPGCTNLVWVAVNVMLRARGLQGASAAAQEAWFDVAAAVAAAATCSATVEKIIGEGTEEQFRFVGVIGEEKPLRDWLAEILSCGLGYATHVFGKLKVGIRQNSSAVEAFTVANILQDSLQLAAFTPACNDLSIAFADEDYQYQQNTVNLVDTDSVARVGPLKANVNSAGIPTKSQAARVLTVKLRESLGGLTAEEQMAARRVAFRSTVLALSVEPGMVCSMTHADMPGGSGEFRVTSWRLNSDWSIDIAGTTTTDSMYDLTVGEKPADVVPDPVPDKIWYDVEVGAAPQPPQPVSGVTLTVQDLGEAFGLEGAWVVPDPLGGNVGYAREVQYFLDAACTQAETGRIPLGVVDGEELASAAAGPFPRNVDGDRWARLWVAGRNVLGVVSEWAVSAPAMIAAGTAPGGASLPDPLAAITAAISEYTNGADGDNYAHVAGTFPVPADADVVGIWVVESATTPAAQSFGELVAVAAERGAYDFWYRRPRAGCRLWVMGCAADAAGGRWRRPSTLEPRAYVDIPAWGVPAQPTSCSVTQSNFVNIDGADYCDLTVAFTPPASADYQWTVVERYWADASWNPAPGEGSTQEEAWRKNGQIKERYSFVHRQVKLPSALTRLVYRFRSADWSGKANDASAVIVQFTQQAAGGLDLSKAKAASIGRGIHVSGDGRLTTGLAHELSNPTFDFGLADWSFGSGWSADSAEAITAPYSAKGVPNGSNAFLSQDLPAMPGDVFTLDAMARTTIAGGASGMGIAWFDSAGAYIGEASVALAGDVAVKYTLTATMPAGVGFVRVFFKVAAAAAAGRVLVDQVNVMRVEALTGGLERTASGTRIADGGVTPAKFQAGTEPVAVVYGVPSSFTGQRLIYNSQDGKMYRWNGLTYGPVQTAAEIKSQLQVSGLTAAEFAASIEPVGVVTATANSAGELVIAKSQAAVTNTTDGKLYRWDAATSRYRRPMSGADVKEQLTLDRLTAGQIAAGAISTEQLSATEILLGGGGGKCPRFRVNDAFGTMIGFIGDDGASFVGGYLSRARIGGTFASPRLDASSSGLTLNNAALAISSPAAFLINLDTANGLKITDQGAYSGAYLQVNNRELRAERAAYGESALFRHDGVHVSKGGWLGALLRGPSSGTGGRLDLSIDDMTPGLLAIADSASNRITSARPGSYLTFTGAGSYVNASEYRSGNTAVLDANRNYRWPASYAETLVLGDLTSYRWLPAYDANGNYLGKIPLL